MTDQQMDYFIAFLAEEARLIDAHEFEAVNERIAEKTLLCDAFEKHMERVLEHWDDVTPDRRRHLHDMLHKARNNLVLNHQALMRAMELHRQLIKICLNVHEDNQIKLQRYDTHARTQVSDSPSLYTTLKHV